MLNKIKKIFECKVCKLKQLKIEGLLKLRDDLYKEQNRQTKEINLLKNQLKTKGKRNDYQIKNQKVLGLYQKNTATKN